LNEYKNYKYITILEGGDISIPATTIKLKMIDIL